MLNEKVKDFFNTYFGVDNLSIDSIIEVLNDEEPIYKRLISESRHWDQYEFVVCLNYEFIMYIYATTTGDDSAEYLGWTFDPTSIKIVEPYQETVVVTKYRET